MPLFVLYRLVLILNFHITVPQCWGNKKAQKSDWFLADDLAYVFRLEDALRYCQIVSFSCYPLLAWLDRVTCCVYTEPRQL